MTDVTAQWVSMICILSVCHTFYLIFYEIKVNYDMDFNDWKQLLNQDTQNDTWFVCFYLRFALLAFLKKKCFVETKLVHNMLCVLYFSKQNKTNKKKVCENAKTQVGKYKTKHQKKLKKKIKILKLRKIANTREKKHQKNKTKQEK